MRRARQTAFSSSRRSWNDGKRSAGAGHRRAPIVAAIRGVKLPAVAATIGARRCPAPADLLPSFHDLRDDEKAVCLARRIAQCLFRRTPIPWRVFAKDIENWDAMRGSFYAAYI